MKEVCCLLLSILLSTSAIAAGYLQSLGTGTSILKVHAHSNGAITVWINPDENLNPNGCNDASRVHIKSTNPGAKNMLAMVMTAYASNKKIGMWGRQCELIPFWGGTSTRAIVEDLWITD